MTEIEPADYYSGQLWTASGMFAIWRPEYFSHVVDLDTWEDAVAEEASLGASVDSGNLVPINIGSDGAFEFLVRGVNAPDGLTAREREYLAVTSAPYLLRSSGSVRIGGIEGIGSNAPAHSAVIPLGEGRYSVTMYLIDWEAEDAEGRADDGAPGSTLPDFLIEIRPETDPDFDYRTSIETFDRPG